MCFFLFHPCQKTDFYISTLPQMFPYSDLLIRKRKRKILAITRIVFIEKYAQSSSYHDWYRSLLCRSVSYHFSSILSSFIMTDAILLVPKEGCSRVPFSKRQITNWYISRESVCDGISEESLLFNLSMSALAVHTFVIKDNRSGVWDLQRLCLLHRLCQTLGEIHVEGIATDRQKL